MKMQSASYPRLSALAQAVSVAVLLGTSVTALAADESLEEITVTGSRVRMTSGMQTPVPVTAITNSELSDFEPEATLAEQLDDLPQFMQTTSAQRGGVITGTSGASSLNMRGLGGNRTLVLFNGSRVVPNDRSSTVNVDVFPTALMKNIEVVTGGASAAYGADALAGVVNFILDRDYVGLKTNFSTGITEYGDGQNWNGSIAGGMKVGEKLHLVGSIEGRRIHQIDRDTVWDGDMETYKGWGYVTNPAWTPTSPVGVPRQLTLPYVHTAVSSPMGLITVAGSSLNRYTFTDDGKGVRPYQNGTVTSISGTGSTNSMSGGPEAALAGRTAFGNGAPFGNEVKQESIFFGAKYDLTDNIVLHTDVIAGNTEGNSNNQAGNPHLGTTTWNMTIFRENPYLPASVVSAMTAENRSSIVVSKMGSINGVTDIDTNESFHNRYQMWSANAGFDWDLNGNWQLKGSWQSGETDRTSIIYNEVRLDRLFLALDAVKDSTGKIVCNVQTKNPTPAQLAADPSVAGKTFAGQQPLPITRKSPVGMDGSIEKCVPLNPFGYGQNSQAAIDYISDDRIALTHVESDFAELTLDGEIYKGFGAGAVSLATGFTYRKSSFWQNFETNSGDPLDGPPQNAPTLGIRGIPLGYSGASTSMFMFGGIPNINGEFNVKEVFAELNVPLWKSGSGNQALDFNIAGRRSDYSRSGNINSWKYGLSAQLYSDMRVRGTVSRDVREPSFNELFGQQGTGGTVNDPQRNNANTQITLFSGGNPNLKPEIADTYTAGVVYQPSFAEWAKGLQVSVDWYAIQVAGFVGQLGAQRIANECNSGAKELCSLIDRDSTGQITRILDGFLNINAAKVSGVDTEIQYRYEPDFFSGKEESITVRALMGYMRENSQTNLGAAKLEQAGGPGRPKWTTMLATTYNLGNFGATATANFYDSVRVNNLWVEGVDVDDNITAATATMNLAFFYRGDTASGAKWRAAFNITNLFDREPPIVPSFSTRFGSQTISNEYDVYGRRYQLSMNYEF